MCAERRYVCHACGKIAALSPELIRVSSKKHTGWAVRPNRRHLIANRRLIEKRLVLACMPAQLACVIAACMTAFGLYDV